MKRWWYFIPEYWNLMWLCYYLPKSLKADEGGPADQKLMKHILKWIYYSDPKAYDTWMEYPEGHTSQL
jgi:hypothetical protein